MDRVICRVVVPQHFREAILDIADDGRVRQTANDDGLAGITQHDVLFGLVARRGNYQFDCTDRRVFEFLTVLIINLAVIEVGITWTQTPGLPR